MRAEGPIYKRNPESALIIYGAGFQPFFHFSTLPQRFALGWYGVAPLALVAPRSKEEGNINNAYTSRYCFTRKSLIVMLNIPLVFFL